MPMSEMGRFQILERRMEITKDARFCANLRLRNRHKLSSYVVSMLSVAVIGVSLIPNFLSLQDYQNQLLLACTIVLSVFIVVLSLMEGADSFQHQAEVLHESARKINRLYGTLIALDKNDSSYETRASEIAEKYEALLDECTLSHMSSDYLRALAAKPQLFPPHFPNSGIALKFKVGTLYVRSFIANQAWLIVPLCVALTIVGVIVAFILLQATHK